MPIGTFEVSELVSHKTRPNLRTRMLPLSATNRKDGSRPQGQHRRSLAQPINGPRVKVCREDCFDVFWLRGHESPMPDTLKPVSVAEAGKEAVERFKQAILSGRSFEIDDPVCSQYSIPVGIDIGRLAAIDPCSMCIVVLPSVYPEDGDGYKEEEGVLSRCQWERGDVADVNALQDEEEHVQCRRCSDDAIEHLLRTRSLHFEDGIR